LTIGDSRLGPQSGGWESTLARPAGNAVLKHERETLIWRLALPLGEPGIVKMYRRRGVLGRFRGRLLPFRVQREFDALSRLAKDGIPCSLPLLWGWGEAPEHGHFELLLTREIAGAVSLKQHLATPGAPLRSEDWLVLFASLRRMHEGGVYHGALWPKNILLTRAADDTCQFHLIDLARAVCFPGTICGTSMARSDLLSLLYSLGRANAKLDAETMLRGYGYGVPDARTIAAQARRYRSPDR